MAPPATPAPLPGPSPDRVSSFFTFLRAGAILGVFGYHFYSDAYLSNVYMTTSDIIIRKGLFTVFLNTPGLASNPVSALIQALWSFGFIGVELFIVASGFGLYASYASRHRGWPAFFRRRILRVLPLYYLFLGASFLVYAYAFRIPDYTSSSGMRSLLLNVFLLQSFDPTDLYGLFYFVGILVQLYLLFPVLARLAEQERLRLPLFAVFCAAAVFVRPLLASAGIPLGSNLVTDYLPHFFLGVLISRSSIHGGRLHAALFSPPVQAVALVSLAGCLFLLSTGAAAFGPAMRVAISLGALFSIGIVIRILERLRLQRPAAVIAVASFVLYLSHILLLRLFFSYVFSRPDLERLFYTGPVPAVWTAAALACLLAGITLSYAIQRGYDAATVRFARDTGTTRTTVTQQ